MGANIRGGNGLIIAPNNISTEIILPQRYAPQFLRYSTGYKITCCERKEASHYRIHRTNMAETDLKLKNFELKVFHQYAEIILKRYHEHARATLPLPPTGEPLPPLNLGAGAKYVDGLPITRVAIVGAGVAGLRAAMTLGDWFKVDVYDAADDDRIGGRLYTHKFSGGGQYDYFVCTAY